MLRLMIVDDHILFRQGVASLLARQPLFSVVGEAGTVREAIVEAARLKPDLILMDFRLPDGTGLEATQAILDVCPATKIIFLTMSADDENLFAALRSGAKGYLLKDVSAQELILSLEGVVRGEAALPRKMVTRLVDEFARGGNGSHDEQLPAALQTLTRREVEVLKVLAAGAFNHEIARDLVVSENTVKNHIHNMLKKLGLKNRRELIAFAARSRLVVK